MTYLLTGATGFIGSKLAARLLARGDSVHYLGRRPGGPALRGAVFHEWTSGAPGLASLPPLDGVIWLAGEPIAQRWSPPIKDRIYASRVQGTHDLVSALAKLPAKPAALVAASAIGYYGDRGDELLTETSPPGSGFLAKLCVDWEREAGKAREVGIRVAPVRISTVLGREGGALPQMLAPFRFGLGARFGDGRQWVAWIHVDDLVSLFLFALDHPSLEGPLNGSSPEPVTNQTFTRALARAVHRPALVSAPRGAMKLMMGEMADVLFASTRVVPQAPLAGGFHFAHPDLQEALASLVK